MMNYILILMIYGSAVPSQTLSVTHIPMVSMEACNVAGKAIVDWASNDGWNATYICIKNMDRN